MHVNAYLSLDGVTFTRMIMKILIKAGVKVDQPFSGKSMWLNSKVEEETFPNKTILFQHYDRRVFF